MAIPLPFVSARVRGRVAVVLLQLGLRAVTAATSRPLLVVGDALVRAARVVWHSGPIVET
jgi:hypothetical protein